MGGEAQETIEILVVWEAMRSAGRGGTEKCTETIPLLD